LAEPLGVALGPGRSLAATTWIAGSTWTKRARGSTARIACIAAMVARTSWCLSSKPRPRAMGLK
jgi:hypothetical protein